ncbi:Fic family protein [Rothia mucilaginosa]|uniref:Fic family protein n=1 Tax=Rothia mucilaginosa TaxID=43675 RepID=UPI0026F094D3|nr:Fic family protein [Rothia mucilaginosa]
MPSAVTWPALEWEPQDPWVHRDALASRRATRRNSGTFSSAVPASIAALNVKLDTTLRGSLQGTTFYMGLFDKRLHHIGGIPFSAVLLRGESASSSQIENLTVSARKLSLAVLGASGSTVGVNAELVARNVHAMRAALNTAENISVDNILAMHRELTRGLQQDSGMLRTEWVWIKGDSPVTADYVAPHHERVPAALEDLVAFMNRRDIDPLAQAAIAHAQFETIHPFTDGNGRTGRALISSLLRARGVTRHVTLPISSGLLHDTEGYIQALTDYRAGDAEPIIKLFNRAINQALLNVEWLAQDIENLQQQILATAQRKTPLLRSLTNLCCTEPAFTAHMVEEHTQGSRASVYRLLNRMVELQILREERVKIQGQKVWTVPALNRALDDFAARAGRRG